MMSSVLVPGDEIRAGSGAVRGRVERLLGAGGQGEVYQATVGGSSFALKWYYSQTATEEQHSAIKDLIDRGKPSDRFLWPVDLVTCPSKSGFGYLMALRDPAYKSIADLLARRITPTFRSLATAGACLADGFLRLHAKGLCYRDISHGNVFFDPTTGDVLICDNDNVGLERTPGGVLGTPAYMAPEVVRGEALPSTNTDLFSLAVLLFQMLVNHHPLEGRREADIHCFDLPARTRLYGTDPLFIFDPVDPSNEPVPGYQDNALEFWRVYPGFLKALFIKSFTEGLRDPDHGRVREWEWRGGLSRLRDSILYCSCGEENFYDPEAGGPACWRCTRPLQLPPRIRIGKAVIMLNHDSQLFAHHLDNGAAYDFSKPVGEVTRHPTDPSVWGLRNLTEERWTTTTADGTSHEVEPARGFRLAVGTRVHFGKAEGEILL
jgi:DNA-binding helix-hairpin-helix protein with protein kinase domain